MDRGKRIASEFPVNIPAESDTGMFGGKLQLAMANLDAS